MEKKKQRKFKKAKPTQASASVSEKKQPSKSTQTVNQRNVSEVRITVPPKRLGSLHWNIVWKKYVENVKGWMHTHDDDMQLILFPIILCIILTTLSIINTNVVLSFPREETKIQDRVTYLNPYPYIQNITQPTLFAKSAIILDRGSQVVLFSKNPQVRFSMASTTKIMTALIALEHYKPDDILTVKRSHVEGAGLQLYPGEQFRFIDLMYAMLLPSANDAAQAIADNYPGGAEAFIRQMNSKAQSLHLENTHYADPTGLDDDEDYTTVVDLARLASYAISDPSFVEITSTKTKTITNISGIKRYTFENRNKLLGSHGVTGVKIGTTEGAREVLVTSAVKNGHIYIIIVMDSTDRFADTRKLLSFIDEQVQYVVPPSPR